MLSHPVIKLSALGVEKTRYEHMHSMIRLKELNFYHLFQTLCPLISHYSLFLIGSYDLRLYQLSLANFHQKNSC